VIDGGGRNGRLVVGVGGGQRKGGGKVEGAEGGGKGWREGAGGGGDDFETRWSWVMDVALFVLSIFHGPLRDALQAIRVIVQLQTVAP